MCWQGMFKDVNGSAACTLCALGKYSAATAATSEATCDDCPAQSYSVAGSKDVANCSCNLGFTGVGGRECKACAAGKYKDVIGLLPCVACTRNTYPAPNASACLPCPEHSFSEKGSYNRTYCVCWPGYSSIATGQKCTACAPNTFKSVNGSSACIACDKGKFSSAAAVACASPPLAQTCPQGYTGRGCLIREPSKSEGRERRAFLVALSLTVEQNVSVESSFQDDVRGNLSEFFTVSADQVDISNISYRRSSNHIGFAAAVVVVDSREDFVSNASAIESNLRDFILYVHSSLNVTSLHVHCGQGFGYNTSLDEPCVQCGTNLYQEAIKNSTCKPCPALMISPQASGSSKNCTCQVFVYYS